MSRESELSALARQFPGWEAWKGVSGLFYARLRGTTDQPVRGEDVTDLADQIERAERLTAAGELPAGRLARIRRGPSSTSRPVSGGPRIAGPAHLGRDIG